MHERDEKRAAVEKLAEMIREAESMIVTDYRGLTVAQLADVRNQLREAGASRYRGQEHAGPDRGRARRTGLTWSSSCRARPRSRLSPTTRRRLPRSSARSPARHASCRCVERIIEGETLTADEVRQLGDLPPRDVLLAQVVGALASPLQGSYNTLAAPLREFLVVLDEYIEKRQAAEAA